MSKSEYVMDYAGWAKGMNINAYFKVRDAMHARKRERIVRCPDCEYCREKDMRCYGGKRDQLICHKFSMCDGAGRPVEPDGFCSWGKRKDDE